MQSVVIAYSLTMAMLIPASGWLADRLGTRTVYFSAIALFVTRIGAVRGVPSLRQLALRARGAGRGRLDAAAGGPAGGAARRTARPLLPAWR